LFRTPLCGTGECGCKKVFLSGQVHTAENCIDPSGLNKPVMVTSAPLRDTNGVIVGALEYCVDLTDVKRAERIANKIDTFQKGEVQKLAATMDRLAAGDLTVDYSVASADQDVTTAQAFGTIAESTKRTVQSLRAIIGQVAESATQFSEEPGWSRKAPSRWPREPKPRVPASNRSVLRSKSRSFCTSA
jgi:methyl-accepting chemotaxis protein